MQDYSVYAGHWVTLDEEQRVAGVGNTPEEAQRAGSSLRPKGRLRLARITATAPHLALPAWPFEALRPLAHDLRLWLVGGAVRDLLLQRPAHDWDFVVGGRATTLARRAADTLGGAYMLLDAEHDTARAIVADPQTQQPVTLDFAGLRGATLEDDLYARDFTLNAIALTPDGELVDPTGGQRDIAERRIRVTTERSFVQDPARLFRALRMAAELGFTIEAPSLDLMRSQAKGIESVAAERVRPELLRILQTETATVSLRQAETLGLLAYVLPEITALRQVEQSKPHHYANVLDHSYAVVAAMKVLLAQIYGRSPAALCLREVAAPNWAWARLKTALLPYQTALLAYLAEPVTFESTRADLLSWGALFHDAGKAGTRTVEANGTTHFYGHTESSAEIVQTRFTELRFATKAQLFVNRLVAEHMRLSTLSNGSLPLTRRAVYRFFRDTGDAGVAVVLLSLGDVLAVFGPQLPRDTWQRVLRVATGMLAGAFTHSEIVVAPPQLLNGHDLQALGVEQGPRLGALLEQLREAQAAGEVQTREQAEAFIGAAIAADKPATEGE